MVHHCTSPTRISWYFGSRYVFPIASKITEMILVCALSRSLVEFFPPCWHHTQPPYINPSPTAICCHNSVATTMQTNTAPLIVSMVQSNTMWSSQFYTRHLSRLSLALCHRILRNHDHTILATHAKMSTRKALDTAPIHDTFKKKTAVHVAYVGTRYHGLQLQPAHQGVLPVEQVLQDAMFNAGLILPTNLDQQKRLKWTRSSRTDKGVHSLATVISCVLEVQEHEFEFDPRGQRLVNEINKHLPEDVCVLSVQRVNKRFDARSMCALRTYTYYLPLKMLDPLKTDACPSSMLTQAWKMFEGQHPFHNYTRRALYRPRARRWEKKSKNQASESEEEESDQDIVDHDVDQDAGFDEHTDDAQPSTSSSSNNQRTQSYRFQHNGIHFLETPDPADPITAAHWRRIQGCRVDGPIMLGGPHGVPCMRLQVTGESFMLHQIRHMVGASVAAALGLVPLEMLAASLLLPTRITMPLAPACTLVLESSSFHDFPPLDQSPVIPLTGVRLDLPPEGLALQQAFEYSRLYPALTELCRAQEWDTWRGNLAHTHYPAEAVNDLLTRAVPWVDIMEQKRVEKAERKAALQAERGHREDTKWKRRRYSRF